MKTMKVPRGTARTLRRSAPPMKPPSSEAQAAMLSDQKHLNRKMGIALFQKHGTARIPF
jgi:hypothetical protein